MKSNNFLADEMNIRGPETSFLILRPADSTEVRGERVEPDVKDMRFFARDGNAPAYRGACDAEIPEATFDKAENFIPAGFRLNEGRMLSIPVEKRFLKC